MVESEREEYVSVADGLFWTARSGEGLPMVLLHGGPGGHDDLAPVAAMVDDLFEVHRYDQRSCGRSSGGPPFTLQRWLEDLDELRAHWGYERWIVGGHSFGAAVALAYALRFPERVRAVVYMSCLLVTGARGAGHAEFLANRLARVPSELQLRMVELRRLRDEKPEAFTAVHDRELRAIGLAAEFGDGEAADAYSQSILDPLWPLNREVNAALGEDFAAWSDRPELKRELSELDVPVLIVHGERDLRPLWAAEELAKALPRAELQCTPGGHFPWLESPGPLRRALRAFLEGVIGSA